MKILRWKYSAGNTKSSPAEIKTKNTNSPLFFTSVKNSLLYQIHHNIKNSPLYKSNTQMPKEYHNWHWSIM